jgi:hypothetical protein
MPRTTPPVLKIVAEGAGYRAFCDECPGLSVYAPTFGMAEFEGNSMVNGWRSNPAAFVPQLVTSAAQITAPPAVAAQITAPPAVEAPAWVEPEAPAIPGVQEGADVPEHPDDIPADRPRRGRPPKVPTE